MGQPRKWSRDTGTFENVANLARLNTARAAISKRERQTRVPWSEADAQFLINAIQEFGCSWSTINKLGDWEFERDQVALKDKARNMKVAFLKSGVGLKDLPKNFDKIALGQKEINAIRSVIPDFEPWLSRKLLRVVAFCYANIWYPIGS